MTSKFRVEVPVVLVLMFIHPSVLACMNVFPSDTSLMRESVCDHPVPNATHVVLTNYHHRPLFERMFKKAPPCAAEAFTVICLDDESYRLCRKDRKYTCVRALTNATASDYEKGDYRKIMYNIKYSVVSAILATGRSVFLFDDDVTIMDVPRVPPLKSVKWWYQAERCTRGINGGVMLIHPTERTLRISDFMCVSDDPRLDQEVLATLLRKRRVVHSVLPLVYTGKCCVKDCNAAKHITVFHAHCAKNVPQKLACLDTILS